jgi:hypothetical protein
MFYSRILACIVLAALVHDTNAQPMPITFVNEPPGILRGSDRAKVLRQCSRPTPNGVIKFWTPSPRDVQELEEALSSYLRSAQLDRSTKPRLGAEYGRQYVGIVRNGEKLIYGNFYFNLDRMYNGRANRAFVICDGGNAFWGVVFDPKTRIFSELYVNGEA